MRVGVGRNRGWLERFRSGRNSTCRPTRGQGSAGQSVVRDLLVSLMTVNYHACRVALSDSVSRHVLRIGEPVGVSE